MNDKTEVVIAIRYLFNLTNFNVIKKYDVIGVFHDKNEKEIEKFISNCEYGLESIKEKVDDDFNMLTSFSIERKNLDGILSEKDVKRWVRDNCSSDWDKSWKEDFQIKR